VQYALGLDGETSIEGGQANVESGLSVGDGGAVFESTGARVGMTVGPQERGPQFPQPVHDGRTTAHAGTRHVEGNLDQQTAGGQFLKASQEPVDLVTGEAGGAPDLAHIGNAGGQQELQRDQPTPILVIVFENALGIFLFCRFGHKALSFQLDYRGRTQIHVAHK